MNRSELKNRLYQYAESARHAGVYDEAVIVSEALDVLSTQVFMHWSVRAKKLEKYLSDPASEKTPAQYLLLEALQVRASEEQ